MHASTFAGSRPFFFFDVPLRTAALAAAFVFLPAVDNFC